MRPDAAPPLTPPRPVPAARWLILEGPAAVAREVAGRLLAERLERPARPLGLATGRTMQPVYEALARRVAGLPEAAGAALRRDWLSYNLDEYVGLGPADAGSFRAGMHAQLTLPLGLDATTVRIPDGLAPDPAAEAERYADALAAAGGIGLQLLGLGENGHVGFNEPPCRETAPCRCVCLSPSTLRQNAAAFGGDIGAVPRQAITLGLREILAAERILLVVTGAAKAEVLRRAFALPPDPQLPASWLQLHPSVTVIADAAAAPRPPLT